MRLFSFSRLLLCIQSQENCLLRRFPWKSLPSNITRCNRGFTTSRLCRTAMDLSSVVSVLKTIGPTKLAEDWDNVGLLIEPSESKQVSHVMLTIDLTEAVLAEAVVNDVDLIVAYHPPIFKPLKNLQNDNWKNYIALKCIENKIAVYSPHTALDNIDGGINDWLLQCFDCSAIIPISGKEVKPEFTHDVKFNCSYSFSDYKERLGELLPHVKISDSTVLDGSVSGTMKADESDLGALHMLAGGGNFFSISEISRVQSESSISKNGVGRQALLAKPIKISDAVEKVKNHLNLTNIRVSLAKDCTLESAVQSVAVCAGSGAQVLCGIRADLLLTGEMSHHELLDAAHRGSTVILTEHSNSERPYLTHLAEILKKQLPGVNIVCSVSDKDPVMIV